MRRRRPSVRLLLCLGYSAALIMLGVWTHSTGLPGEVINMGRKLMNRPLRRIKASMKATPEHLVIDIKHKNFQKIAYQRELALKRNTLLTSSDDFVGADLRHGDKSVKVKVRLKGDMIDHLIEEKWSYRVIVKGDNSLLGMKRFSVHHPRTRRWLGEWLYHQVMRREGIIGLRYDFVNVTVNGKDHGIYALEEHFGKRLLENNDRREGPIVRFNETMFWQGTILNDSLPDRNIDPPLTMMYLASDIDGFQTSRWLSTPAGSKVYARAMHLLEAFRRGDLKSSQVFDIEKMATYFALTDVLGSEHGSRWHNIRFYYNPVTARLEPIAFDGNAGHPITRLVGTNVYAPRAVGKKTPEFDFYAQLFSDPAMFDRYFIA